MKSVGFKEWALVCEALGRGEQSVILRKGGIAEGRRGFEFKHREFFLFPTYFHEHATAVRTGAKELPQPRDGEIEIRYFAKMDDAKFVTSWDEAAALEPLHILHEDVVRERFGYGPAAGLHVAYVRTFRLQRPWIIPDSPSYGGCRSWVELPDPPADLAFEPVAG